MRISDALSNLSIVGLDTSPFIYFVEKYSSYFSATREIFEAIDRGDLRALTSVTTMTEVLVLPLRQNNLPFVNAYRDLLINSQKIELLPVSRDIAEEAARLRAQYNLRVPDAFQMATSLITRCDAFITNDSGFKRVTEIQILLLDELTL